MRARRLWWNISLFGLIGWTGVWGRMKILGEISFDLKVPGEKPEKGEKFDGKQVERSGHVTKAEPVECIYQYPEDKQVNALLSNMMNHLTKMFVRVDNYMRESDSRRNKRFKVVSGKKSSFFDEIYFNMTEEYRKFANHTQKRVLRASDPCEHQSEIRDVWRALLDSSQEAVRRAALSCVEQYLRVSRAEGSKEGEGEGERGRARSHASQLLRREISRVRRDQLALLCDHFQLCYNDLL